MRYLAYAIGIVFEAVLAREVLAEEVRPSLFHDTWISSEGGDRPPRKDRGVGSAEIRVDIALSEHVLLIPEGDSSRRRHAHSACVLRARRQGRLATREEWLRTQPRPPSVWRRALARLRSHRR